MMPDNAALLLVVVTTGVLLAMMIYRAVIMFASRPMPLTIPTPVQTGGHQPVFLFDSDFLVDATASATDLIANRAKDTTEMDALTALLERQFPSIRDELENLDETDDSKVLTSDGLGLTVTLRQNAGLTRIALGGDDAEDNNQFAAIERAAQTEELTLLRNLTDNAPQMIWLENTHGELLWANAAYLSFGDKLAEAAEKSKTVWPDNRLFNEIQNPEPGDLVQRRKRYAIKSPALDGDYWYEVTSVPQAGGVLHYAVDINDTVRAELAKRDFQQTLSKTFAQLATGLAIFDRNRKLTMFNPALLDLTGLPIDFLSARPSIQMVLDRLREAHKLPEPKNYASWREQFTALENAAENGSYCEIWDLPEGLTYRVTGRPHPDGALAFLFEDISAEVLLTRRFRTEIETSQAVLDTLPEAIAVFSNASTLVTTNAAYDALWGVTDADTVLSRDLRGSIRTWKSQCVASRIWRDVEDVATAQSERAAISDQVTLNDGRNLVCHTVPLSGGMTMVKFVISPAIAPALHKLSIGDPVQRLVKN